MPGLDLPLDRTELLTGLAAGSVALAVAVLASKRLRVREGGLLFAGAALVGLGLTHDVPGGLVAGVGLVAVGAVIARAARLLVRVAAVAPGAWVVAAHGAVPGERWVRVLVFATIVAGGALVADLDGRSARRGLGPVLFAISVAGVYATVPDTEQALVLLGAAAPVALLGWPLGRAGLGRAGSPTAVALLAWTAAVGGVGRPSSIVGAVACLGLFVAGPACGLRGRPGPGPGPVPVPFPVVVAVHALLVAVSARVAGLRPTVRGAVAVVAVELAVAVAVCGLARRHP